MTVSIIIAVKNLQRRLEECVAKCLELEYPDFEVLVMPDAVFTHTWPQRVRVIPTGAVSPAKKRDIALDQARGEILAFIDDDAYPEKNWLKNALKDFADAQVAAVGGPAVTPAEDSAMQKASGVVFATPFVSGRFVYRYLPKRKGLVDDFPTVNLLVRKSVMRELGGFNTDFWPGEDTKLCLDITKKLGRKIVYDPEVIVWHHRRPLFLAHIRQVASYALHRGYFVKKYPQTSLKAAYFLPSILACGLFFGGILSLFFAGLRPAYFIALAMYLALALIFSLFNKAGIVLPVFAGIILTHLAYGVYFLKGLASRGLKQ